MFFQMDDGFESDPRVLQAGTAAFGLYARCGIWAAHQLTDGFIPAELAALYGTREWIERLTATGLWAPVEGGFTMPDYLEPHGNWSAEKIRAHRAAAAERQARARTRRTGYQHDDTSRRESRVTHASNNGVSHSTPSHPIPIEEPPDDSLRSSSPPTGGHTDTKKPKTQPKRGTRIPEAFALTDEMRTWGKEHFPQVNGEAETEAFTDYWRSMPGQRGTKLDWQATWRNWIRKAAEQQARTARTPTRANAERPVHIPRPIAEVLAEQRTHGQEGLPVFPQAGMALDE